MAFHEPPHRNPTPDFGPLWEHLGDIHAEYGPDTEDNMSPDQVYMMIALDCLNCLKQRLDAKREVSAKIDFVALRNDVEYIKGIALLSGALQRVAGNYEEVVEAASKDIMEDILLHPTRI